MGRGRLGSAGWLLRTQPRSHDQIADLWWEMGMETVFGRVLSGFMGSYEALAYSRLFSLNRGISSLPKRVIPKGQ